MILWCGWLVNGNDAGRRSGIGERSGDHESNGGGDRSDASGMTSRWILFLVGGGVVASSSHASEPTAPWFTFCLLVSIADLILVPLAPRRIACSHVGQFEICS